MMKRPRSFISTLIVFLSLMAVPVGLTMNSHDASAGGMPRVMDPRAGDPTQPGDGFLPSDNTTTDPGDPPIVSTRRSPLALASSHWHGLLWTIHVRSVSFYHFLRGGE